MRNAILVHGKPSQKKFENPELLDPSDSNWLPWAKRQLTLRGIFAVAPDMPKPYQPVYEDWVREFERHDVHEETILVGHSAGAGFLVRWMNQRSEVTVAKLVLVAPWLDPNRKYGDLFDFEIDPRLAERCLGGMAIFYSSQDDEQARRSTELLISTIEIAKAIDIPAYGHFLLNNTMTSMEFPELLDEIP